MKTTYIVLIGLLVTSAVLQAGGEPEPEVTWGYFQGFQEAGQLLSWCEDGYIEREGEHNFCDGYLMAVAELLWKQPERKICITNFVSTDQLRKLFITHARQHPEKKWLPAGLVIQDAFTAAFPCSAAHDE